MTGWNLQRLARTLQLGEGDAAYLKQLNARRAADRAAASQRAVDRRREKTAKAVKKK